MGETHYKIGLQEASVIQNFVHQLLSWKEESWGLLKLLFHNGVLPQPRDETWPISSGGSAHRTATCSDANILFRGGKYLLVSRITCVYYPKDSPS